MPNISIRPAEARDAAAITALAHTALGHRADEQTLARRLGALLGDPLHHILVAEDDSGVVGFAHVCGHDHLYQPHQKSLMAIAVNPATRGRGTGKLLLAAVEDWARADGAAAVHIVADASRLDAHYLYRSAGYGDEKAKSQFVKWL